VFQPEGERLRWIEYPIVSFSDEGGRFRRGRDDFVREVGHWEPNAAQAREIRAGLKVNPREKRDQLLRRKVGGWSSAEATQAYDSARFVTWTSVWEVDLAGGAPSFTTVDSLGSAAASPIQGRTEYLGETVLEGGSVVEGRYRRDESRVGSFRLTRSGARDLLEAVAPPREVEKEEVYDRFYRQLGRELRASDALPERVAPSVARATLQDQVREELEARYRNQGNDPRPHAPQIEKLADAISGLYLEGHSRDEIGRMLQEGRLRP
jgi:hypothetical protein